MIDYGKIAILGALVAIVFGSGWYLGNSRYVNYKAKVEAIAHEQEEKVKSIRSQQELITKGIQDEYDAKLSAIRNYYKSTSVWNNSSSSPMSTNSGITTKPFDALTAYNLLAGQCAETTQQLVSLQAWLNEQMGIK
jgi:hypothetical protein